MASQGTSPGCGRDLLFCTLEMLNISTKTKAYDSELHLDCDMDGTYCKNLLLKDRKGNFYLVIIPIRSTIDLKSLKQKLQAHRNLSFASVHDMWQLLHITPGSVTPFGIIFGNARHVRVIVDQALSSCDRLYFHPFISQEATSISWADFEKFMAYFQHVLEVYDLFNGSGHNSRPTSSDSVTFY